MRRPDPTELSLPDGAEYVRTTPTFTEESVPPALLATHQVAANTWAILTVQSGSLQFVFDDQATERQLRSGESQVIPPLRPHHLILGHDASFAIAFYRPDISPD